VSKPYSGRCVCGSVRATITGEPFAVALCWCRQCQQIAAGGATANAIFQQADIGWSGKLATHSYAAASGNTATHRFCPECGTQVYGESSAYPGVAAVRLGFLDAGHGLKPGSQIWTDEAPEWAVIDPTLSSPDQQAPDQG
jgi:hypothetical protein